MQCLFTLPENCDVRRNFIVDRLYICGDLFLSLPLSSRDSHVATASVATVLTIRNTQAQPYDFAVDWWALGVLFFTMLKGRVTLRRGRGGQDALVTVRRPLPRRRVDGVASTASRRCQTPSPRLPRRRIVKSKPQI